MTQTVPVQVPPWVRVVVLRAAFAVECAGCKATDWLYQTVVMRDPGAIARAVEWHRGHGLGWEG